jgi:putative redox protein
MSITAKSARNYQVNLTSENHQFIVDEPAGIGDDAGPCPFDLLLGALASCMIITVQMYARRKNWQLESVQMSSAIETKEELLSDGSKKRSSVITNQISFLGNLDAVQVKRLTEIAGHCPIHRALGGDFTIYTKTLELTENERN